MSTFDGCFVNKMFHAVIVHLLWLSYFNKFMDVTCHPLTELANTHKKEKDAAATISIFGKPAHPDI